MNLVVRQLIKSKEQIVEQQFLKDPLDRDYWKTQNGKILLPIEFDNNHLKNAIHYIERRADDYCNICYNLYKQKKRMSAIEAVKKTHLYKLLKQEAERRGILC
jgi:hypothetical protein